MKRIAFFSHGTKEYSGLNEKREVKATLKKKHDPTNN
jgi:hypothetical protein